MYGEMVPAAAVLAQWLPLYPMGTRTAVRSSLEEGDICLLPLGKGRGSPMGLKFVPALPLPHSQFNSLVAGSTWTPLGAQNHSSRDKGTNTPLFCGDPQRLPQPQRILGQPFQRHRSAGRWGSLGLA